MFRKYLLKRFYVQSVIYSEGPMFRRFYVEKVLYSEGPIFRRSYVQKVLCSEKKMFKRSYIQKVLCSEGPIFRYIQKVLYSENSLFYVGKNIHLSISTCKLGLQCKITNHRLSFELIRSYELLSWRVVRRLSVHNLPKLLLGLQST